MANGKIRFGKQSGGELALVVPDGVTNTEVIVPERGALVSVDGGVTDNAIARFNGTTGKLQNSGVTIDDNSVLAIGGYYGSWQYGRKALTVGDAGISCFPSNQQIIISSNMRYDGSHKFITNGAMGVYSQSFGQHIWSNSLGGVAGETATTVEHLRLDASGNLLLKSGTGGLGYGTGAGGTVTQLTSKSTAVTLNKPTGRITTHNEALASGASVSFTLLNNLLQVGDTLTMTTNGYSSYVLNCINLLTGQAGIRITNIGISSQTQAIEIQFNVTKGSNS